MAAAQFIDDARGEVNEAIVGLYDLESEQYADSQVYEALVLVEETLKSLQSKCEQNAFRLTPEVDPAR